MTCKYLSDEFTAVCTNADSPCKADACPCLNYPQICKYAAEKRNPEMDMKIEELYLSVRAYNALKRANINTVGEILQKTPDQLIKTRSIGEKVFKEIWHKVEAAGYAMPY